MILMMHIVNPEGNIVLQTFDGRTWQLTQVHTLFSQLCGQSLNEGVRISLY